MLGGHRAWSGTGLLSNPPYQLCAQGDSLLGETENNMEVRGKVCTAAGLLQEADERYLPSG